MNGTPWQFTFHLPMEIFVLKPLKRPSLQFISDGYSFPLLLTDKPVVVESDNPHSLTCVVIILREGIRQEHVWMRFKWRHRVDYFSAVQFTVMNCICFIPITAQIHDENCKHRRNETTVRLHCIEILEHSIYR